MALRNEVVIEGRLVRYELKVLNSGKSIGTGSISRSTGKDKPSAFFNFEIWDPNEETNNFLEDASKAEKKPFVRLIGSLRQDIWEDKKTKKERRSDKITAMAVEPVDLPEVEQKSTQSQKPTNRTVVNTNRPSAPARQPSKRPAPPVEEAPGEDIPF